MFFRIVVALVVVFGSCASALAADQTLLGGKATVTLPADLTPMSEELKKAKYAGANAPQEVFGNERGTVSFAAKAGAYPKVPSLDALVGAMAAGIDKAGIVASWKNKGTKKIGDQEFGVLEFTSKAADTELYNHIYFTKRGDEMIVFTVNSTVGLLDEWRDRLDAVVASTRIVQP